MSLKVKSVNAYIKNNKTFVCIKLENGETVFVNEGLLAYACHHAKPVKESK